MLVHFTSTEAAVLNWKPLHCNDPKILHKQVWANSVDPDQTAP